MNDRRLVAVIWLLALAAAAAGIWIGATLFRIWSGG